MFFEILTKFLLKMKMNNVSDAQILIIDAGAQYGKVSWFDSFIVQFREFVFKL